jgi:hypothetical protein
MPKAYSWDLRELKSPRPCRDVGIRFRLAEGARRCLASVGLQGQRPRPRFCDCAGSYDGSAAMKSSGVSTTVNRGVYRDRSWGVRSCRVCDAVHGLAGAMAVNLRRERHARKLSQEELADRAGLSARYLGSLVRQKMNARPKSVGQKRGGRPATGHARLKLPPKIDESYLQAARRSAETMSLGCTPASSAAATS